MLRQLGHLADTAETANSQSTPHSGEKDPQDQDNSNTLQLLTQECADCLLVFTNLLKEYANGHTDLSRAQGSNTFLRTVLLICVADVAGALKSLLALLFIFHSILLSKISHRDHLSFLTISFLYIRLTSSRQNA